MTEVELGIPRHEIKLPRKPKRRRLSELVVIRPIRDGIVKAAVNKR